MKDQAHLKYTLFPKEPESCRQFPSQMFVCVSSIQQWHWNPSLLTSPAVPWALLLERFSVSTWAELLLSWLVRGLSLYEAVNACPFVFLFFVCVCIKTSYVMVATHTSRRENFLPHTTLDLFFCTQRCDLAQKLVFNMKKILVADHSFWEKFDFIFYLPSNQDT